ncbi:hypothetical protein NEOLI_001694 [Neolecta irregularis DAH-3]|uniref:Uncharacterized protein n=1 Tax=Neolecta irregularis (strain DAH-3) TaxID=1198029 RepID=A0A1U7LGF1_NEOID|nr:hypothetical protein NEOLI_001694 [Neolecta irregularis DAH-3]|eukprot:OLL21727.1 hypothetical protein NEOLI_001694 [Neolecta irregularis DAH-3]
MRIHMRIVEKNQFEVGSDTVLWVARLDSASTTIHIRMVPADTQWDNCSNLLLAQFIYKNGDGDFEKISSELESHPFMSEYHSPTPDVSSNLCVYDDKKSCERRYKELLQENDLKRE